MAVLDERAGPLLTLLYATPGDPHAASRFVRALCSAMKNLFAKTDTSRQASLMRLLISGPGQLRPREPDANLSRRRRRRSKP